MDSKKGSKSVQQNQRYHTLFIPYIPSLPKPGTYITHSAIRLAVIRLFCKQAVVCKIGRVPL